VLYKLRCQTSSYCCSSWRWKCKEIGGLFPAVVVVVVAASFGRYHVKWRKLKWNYATRTEGRVQSGGLFSSA